MCYKKATCSFNDLPQIMGWMVQSGNGSQLPGLVYKLSLAASLYNVHEERRYLSTLWHKCAAVGNKSFD